MKQAIYLKTGISGKQLQSAKSATNKAIKADNTSFSFCLKQVLKHDQDFLTSFVKFSKADMTPTNLMPLLGEKEAKHGKFSSHLVMSLIKRYYASK